MAKNHVLPRYLLWVALCLCMLLGSGLLGSNRHGTSLQHHAAGFPTWPLGRQIVRNTDTSTLAYFVTSSVGQRRRVRSREVASAFSKRPVRLHTEQPIDRLHLRAIYTAEIGVREATGNNDGKQIEEYLRYCHLGAGHAWCAAFVSWCFGQAGYQEPRNPWSPALFPASRIIWDGNDPGRNAMNGRNAINRVSTGDVFGIYYTNLRRIGHVGFVDRWEDKHCITVEGNTGPDLAIDDESGPANPIRAGPTEGVYRKRRPIRTIHAVANWIDNPS